MWAPPKLYAISDLHVAHPENRRAVSAIAPHPNDWLIVAGDVAERFRDVRWGLETLRRRFRRMLWVPGNHDLWTLPAKSATCASSNCAGVLTFSHRKIRIPSGKATGDS
jgi:3',5'-cyclic AMP phosphodiesterase CpdA